MGKRRLIWEPPFYEQSGATPAGDHDAAAFHRRSATTPGLECRL